RIRAIEVRLAGEDPGEQQGCVDRRELHLLEPGPRVHVEEMVEEPVIPGGARGGGVLGCGPEEAQRGDDALCRLGARYVIALDADRIRREREPDRRDAREGRGRGAVGGEAVARARQVPEVVEGARLDGVEERGGLGRVEGDRWGRWRALGVVDTAPREDRR